MSTANSRRVLDWLRTWSIGKLDVVGRTDITSNMNVPLNNDVRVQAAVNYVNGIRADALTVALTYPDDLWGSTQDAQWADIEATMPTDVRAAWDDLWGDSDPNVLVLLKSLIVSVCLLYFVSANGG